MDLRARQFVSCGNMADNPFPNLVRKDSLKRTALEDLAEMRVNDIAIAAEEWRKMTNMVIDQKYFSNDPADEFARVREFTDSKDAVHVFDRIKYDKKGITFARIRTDDGGSRRMIVWPKFFSWDDLEMLKEDKKDFKRGKLRIPADGFDWLLNLWQTLPKEEKETKDKNKV
jgi:hypothetical protein